MAEKKAETKNIIPINTVICSDTLKILQTFPDDSIDCVITSPPYWGLRDYGEGTCKVWGGNTSCKHKWEKENIGLVHENRNFQQGTQEEVHNSKIRKGTTYIKKYDAKSGGFCQKCGAWYGQLGLEPTPELYVKHLSQVFHEVKRVVKKTGTFFLNMGDTYGGSMQGYGAKGKSRSGFQDVTKGFYAASYQKPPMVKLMPKCLLMMPERLAMALIDDGWILRNKIIWEKPNAMPCSVKDRFSNKWEYVYFFSKSKHYWFDLDAVRVPHKYPADVQRRMRQDHAAGVNPFKKGTPESRHSFNIRVRDAQKGRLKKKYGDKYKASDEEIKNYDEKHYQGKFDNMGNDAEKYGSPRARTQRKIEVTAEFFKKKGSGGNTNLPWRPKTGNENSYKAGGMRNAPEPGEPNAFNAKGKNPGDVMRYDSKYSKDVYGQSLQGFIRDQSIIKLRQQSRIDAKKIFPDNPEKQQEYINLIHDHAGHPRGKNPGDFWEICTKPFKGAHFAVFPEDLCVSPIKAGCPPDGVVLDPFGGSGTVGVVAKKLGRNYILIDIKEDYCKMAQERIDNMVVNTNASNKHGEKRRRFQNVT